jgi:hypothetical protein
MAVRLSPINEAEIVKVERSGEGSNEDSGLMVVIFADIGLEEVYRPFGDTS